MTEIKISNLHTHAWETSLFGADESESFQALKADICERGLITPIHITPDRKIGSIPPNTIIAGHRRVRALKELGKKKIAAVVLENLKTENDINLQFLSDNILRRKLDKVQRVLVYQKLVSVESDRAKERQVATLKKGDKKPVKAKLPEREAVGQARDLAAKKLGLSGKAMDNELRAFEYLNDGEFDPNDEDESINKWKCGEITTSYVLELLEIRNKLKKQAAAAEKARVAATPPKKEPHDVKEYQPQETKDTNTSFETPVGLPEGVEETDSSTELTPEAPAESVPEIDIVMDILNQALEVIQNKKYTEKHKRIINKLFLSCKKAF